MVKKRHWLSNFGAIEVEERTFLHAGHLVRAFSAGAGVKCRGHSGPLQRRINEFGAEESFAKAACAKRVGLGARTPVLGVGGGAPRIADPMEWIFGAQGRYLIDFYLLCDYLAAASQHCATDGQAWYETQKARTKAGAREEVLDALAPHLEPPEVDDTEAAVRACHRYLRNRPNQFDYPRAFADGLPIGSGEIECAHRYIIQTRLKIPGAWWKVENADKRCWHCVSCVPMAIGKPSGTRPRLLN